MGRSIILALLIVFGVQGKAGLAPSDLANFTYDLGDHSSVEGGKVPLTGGRWKDPADGGSTFTLLAQHAIGDFDADGVADAAAVLVESTAGTGTFSYVFALLSREGRPRQAGPPEWLGDRSVLERLSIDRRGILSVRYITHKASDRECCPTLKIEDRYRVENGILVGITK